MRVSLRRLIAAGLCLGMLLWMAPDAAAFYPAGGFVSEIEGGTPSLRLARWRLRDIEPDGIPITLRGGPDGWTFDERQLIQDAFRVWENVPTSYINFDFTQPIDDDLPLGTDVATADFINFVSKEGPDSDVVPPGTLPIGITFITFISNSGIYEVQGEQVQLTGPALLDVDMAIQAEGVQLSDVMNFGDGVNSPTEGPIPLRSMVVQLVGFLLGLEFDPLSNLESEVLLTPDGPLDIDVDPLVWARRAFGDLELSGVTPVMHPIPGYIEVGQGLYRMSWEALAPSDIAGVTWLYPRQDLENFFTIRQEARTRGAGGVPSQPVPGAFIQAWGNVDNNPNTDRVPMFSTLTGLFEHQEEFSGRFQLINMFRQLETLGGVDFPADYVITMSNVDVEGLTAEDFDSTHRWEFADESVEFAFDVPFTPQVFREGGENLFSMQRVEDGTPLKFDPVRRQIVSTETGRTLPQMLPGTRPMFGTAVSETVCPLNLVAATMAAPHGPEALRGFRDNVLLQNPVGVALADGYYRAAPYITTVLVEQPVALRMAQGALLAFEWSLAQRRALGLFVVGAMLIAFGLLRNRRAAQAAALVLVVAGLFLAAAPAEAQAASMSIERMVSFSDEVVTGEVISVESRWDDQGRIITDVVLQVETAMKGRANRNARLYFSQLGGHVDGITTHVPQYPRWKEGEEVLVFMGENRTFGLMAVGGRAGKFTIRRDPETGERYVAAQNQLSQRALDRASRAIPQAEAKRVEVDAEPDPLDDAEEEPKVVSRFSRAIPLDDLTNHIRRIVRDQERVEQ